MGGIERLDIEYAQLHRTLSVVKLLQCRDL